MKATEKMDEKELSEKERKVFRMFLEEFPDFAVDTFEARHIAIELCKIFREHGEDYQKRELEADLVFLLNSKGKSVVDSENETKILDRLMEIAG